MDGKLIENNLLQIEESLDRALARSQRSRSDVTILAATKKQSIETLRKAFALGVRCFGENYVQEALLKKSQLSDLNIDWHFIGALQSKKVKQIIGEFSLLHSIEKVSTLEEIEKRLDEERQRVLVQVNLAGEQSKSGVAPEELAQFLEKAKEYKHIDISGLMTMPPLATKATESRSYFARLRELRDYYRPLLPEHSMTHLSMGTSQDYTVAVEEGATIVRLGSVLLGERVL